MELDTEQQAVYEEHLKINKERYGEEFFVTEERRAELKVLARDTVEGRVVFALSLPREMVGMCFLPLALSSDPHIIPYDAAVYEYMDKAGSRSINGYPVFMSFQYLRSKSMEIFVQYLEEYEERQKQWMP